MPEMAPLMPGSSPRARGAQNPEPTFEGDPGLIPASAGSTGLPAMCRYLRWAHPRERGEHALLRVPVLAQEGSSPRARGARLLLFRQLPAEGLIPASAGSTGIGDGAGDPEKAHPRERGEHEVASSFSA